MPKWIAKHSELAPGESCTEHLGDRTTEKAPTEMQTECSTIEIDALFDVVDIDVHEKLHQGTSA